MLHYAIAYCVTLVAFLFVDFFWLTRVARDFYAGQIGTLLLASGSRQVFIAFTSWGSSLSLSCPH